MAGGVSVCWLGCVAAFDEHTGNEHVVNPPVTETRVSVLTSVSA